MRIVSQCFREPIRRSFEQDTKQEGRGRGTNENDHNIPHVQSWWIIVQAASESSFNFSEWGSLSHRNMDGSNSRSLHGAPRKSGTGRVY
jgi:hypothetical protein